MQASSSRPSEIVRRVRKGDAQLVASTQGRRHLRLDAYTQTISGLDWRDLGALLAQLTEALDSDKSSRSVSALAATALHMHGAKGEGSQANAAFVTAMFGRMVEACARCVRAADRSSVYPVVRCIARCVRSPQTAFDPAAVLSGITAGACEPDSTRSKKRRRRIAGEADLCVVLTCALDSTSNNASALAAIRVLRAHNVLRYLALSSGTEAVSDLCHALVVRGCDSVGSQTQETGDLFACIRDTMPLAGSADIAQEGGMSVGALLIFDPVMRLVELLAKRVFRPLLADSSALYGECARLRVRCYQWAALCRMATWLALAQPTGTAAAAAALAEGAHVCWLQIVRDPPCAEADDSIRGVWLLLLSESLAHTACLYPQQQKHSKQNALFLQTEESQIRVFTAVASLLAVLPLELERIAGESPLALLYSCVVSCERLLMLVRPRAASMGLFWLHGTASRAKGAEAEGEEEEAEEETPFDCGKTTLAKYIFSAQQSEQSIDRSAADDIARMVGEEAVHEERIAGVFAGLDSAVKAMGAEGRGRLAVRCLRTALLWIRMFASGARDNVGWQTRVLEGLRSAHKPATDWARLQRIPVACDRQARSEGKPASTFRPMVARVLRLLMALAMRPFLKPDGGDAQDLLLVLPLDSEEHASVIKCLATLVSLRELKALSFSALQILASVAGVRLRLFSNSRDPSDLRPPHVQVRDRTPPSSEALLHLAMQLGATALLLHPRLLVRAIECLDPETRASSSSPGERTFVSLQMWLDIVGAVVRHSFFRSFLDAAAFRRWWCLALAASVRSIAKCCRLGVAARDLRMALLVPMHLASWQQYLDTAGPAIRGFTHIMPLLASMNEKVRQDDARLFGWLQSLEGEKALLLFPEAMATPSSSSCSIIPIVYFCACKLWLSVPMLTTEPSEADRPMVARVCRDVWGIAAEMLHLLVRILHQHLSVYRSFVAPSSGLVEDFAVVLSTLTAGHAEFPCVVANIVASNSELPSPAQHSSSDKDDRSRNNGKDKYEENVASSDLITIPLFDSDPPTPATSAAAALSYTLGDENDGGSGSSSAPGNEDSVVDRLLRQTAHQSASGSTTHQTRTSRIATLEEYYSNSMLSILWTNYTDQLKQFPCSLIFSRTTKTTAEPAEVDMARWLDDPDNILRRLFVPLLSSVEQQHRLCRHPSALWAAMAHTFPEQSIFRTMHHASANPLMFLRMSESAAFLLPLSATWSTQMSAMLKCLVAHVVATNEADALLFLALRRRDAVLRNVRLCARQLDDAAEYAASTLSESLHSAEVDQRTVVALSGRNIDSTLDAAPVLVPLDFLVRQSDVFRAMLTGPFREAVGAAHRDSTGRQLLVQSDHATLADLFAIVRAMDQQSLLVSAQLESSYSVERLAECLRLADFYDMRLLVVVLVWFFIDRVVGRAHVIPADSAVWLLSVLYRDNNVLVAAFGGLADSSAAVKALGAVVLLCSDRLDLPDIIGGNVELFVETLRFVFT
ncbi:hypothetical protein GGI23_001882, partial [Coemansia sp. RSA 2559]